MDANASVVPARIKGHLVTWKNTLPFGTYPIWAEFKLADGKPQGYFCRDGSAK